MESNSLFNIKEMPKKQTFVKEPSLKDDSETKKVCEIIKTPKQGGDFSIRLFSGGQEHVLEHLYYWNHKDLLFQCERLNQYEERTKLEKKKLNIQQGNLDVNLLKSWNPRAPYPL